VRAAIDKFAFPACLLLNVFQSAVVKCPAADVVAVIGILIIGAVPPEESTGPVVLPCNCSVCCTYCSIQSKVPAAVISTNEVDTKFNPAREVVKPLNLLVSPFHVEADILASAKVPVHLTQ
jgi:hypothetical protein